MLESYDLLEIFLALPSQDNSLGSKNLIVYILILTVAATFLDKLYLYFTFMVPRVLGPI